MKKLLKLSIKALLLTALLVIPVSGAVLAEDNTIDINMVVSPNVINLESNGGSISVHTDIPYMGISNVILEINEKPVDTSTFQDNCGNLVVKADINDVKDIDTVTAGTYADFVITCNSYGTPCIGSDTVPIIQVIPQKP